MARRNPMNERVTQADERQGKTRKSAASAKPVAKAASSVYIKSNEKPKKSFTDRIFKRNKEDENLSKSQKRKREQEQRAAELAAASGRKANKKFTLLEAEGDTDPTANMTKKQEREARRRYMNPGTKEYKKWRAIWWVVITLGILSLIPPLARPDIFMYDDVSSMIFMSLGWGFLIAAVAIDAIKVRNLRKEARRGVMSDKSKAATKARKQQKNGGKKKK